MTARDVLAEVLRAGGRVIPDPARPRLVVPPALKLLVLAHREALRALVLASASATRDYFHPWPDTLPGLGPRCVGPFDGCARCEEWSWVRYGAVVLCLRCARRREAGASL